MKTLSIAFLIALLLICSSSTPTYGQVGDDPLPPPSDFPAQELRFQNLTIEDGLSQSSVFAIVQDKRGLMWFGTWDGLNRYDGYQFTIYKYDPQDPTSLSNSEIRALFEDSQGELWVGTMNGLCRYDREQDRFVRYQHDPDDLSSLAGNRVHAITEGHNGTLWVGTEDGGLSKFDRHTGQFTRYQHDPEQAESLSHNDIRALHFDVQGVLWIGTWGGGLNRFDPNAERFTSYQHDPNDPASPSDNFVRTVYEDQRGVLWVGTESGGLSRFNRETGQFTNYLPDPGNSFGLSDKEVISIYETDAGELWIGTRGGGLNRLERSTQRFLHYQPIEGNNIWSLYEDRSGVLWIGTSEGGVNMALPNRKNFMHYQHTPDDSTSLSGNDVWSIFEDRDGVLWVGVWDHGLNRFDRQTGTFTHYKPDPEDPHSLSQQDVVAIFEDHEGVLWIGTAEGGLNRFDRQTGRFTHYTHDPDDPQSLAHNFVFGILEDQQHTLWIGSYGGRSLSRFDRDTETFTNFTHDPEDPNSIGDYRVRKLYEDSEGNLWLTTAGGGLSKFDRQTERFTHYTHDPANSKTISHDSTTVICEDRAGKLWIATWGGGLNRFDRETETFTAYREQDGLPSNSVMGILEDEQGNLWLSTFRGISQFDPETETFKNYTPSDGLQSLEFNSTVAFKGRDGRLFFGGINGFNAFYPQEIQDNPHIPPVVLTDFQIFNKAVSIGDDSVLNKSVGELDEITLSYQESVFTFGFAALDYTLPEENRYRYKLEGFDEEWIEVGSDRRLATYTNLDPGEYVFRVLGSNNDGVWNEEGTSINLTITPPWWGTWWFRGGLLLLLVGLVAGGFVLQRQNARRRERDLEVTVAERTHELDERVRQLDCLYGISRLAGQQDISLEQILRGVVDLLPPAMQYPEIACARIVLNGQEFETDDLRETPWQQTSAIVVQGEQAGQVEVAYLEERPDADEGPFLAEERLLLNAVAERLGRIVERKQAEEALRVSEQKFKALFQGMPVPVYTWQRSGNDFVLVDHNDEAEAITGGKIRDFLGTTLPAMYPDRPDIVQDISHAFAGRASFQREMAYSFKSTGEAKTLVVKYAFVPPDLVLVQTEDITERKQAEEALRESENRLELAVAASSGGLWQIDLDPDDPAYPLLDEIYLSPRLKGFLGYEDAEFPNSMAAWESHVHPEDLPRLRESSREYLQGQIPSYELEYRIRHKDGSIRWLRTSGRVERDVDGQPVRFAGIDWDITEPIRAREQLRFQAQLLEAVGQAVVVTDLPGHVVYWNPSAERLYGWSAEEAMGRMTNELLVDSYDQQPIPEIRDHFLAGKSWTGEYTAYHRDGTPVPVETTITPVFNATGELAHVIGVASDITERKQAEEALRVSEKAYRDLVEKISDVIYAVDAGGVITYLNPAIESLIGLPPEQVVGQPFAQFIHPEDLERLQGNIQNLFSGVAPGPAEYRVLNVKGETRWIRVTSQPVVEGDRVTGVQGVLTDITVRKRVEEQLEEAAVREERSRLARDLHDSVTQTLYSTNLFADAAHLAMSTGRTDTATKHLDAVRELIWQAMLEMRLLLFELRPPLLEEIGLVGALESRLESVETRVGLPIEFRVDGDRQLPPTVESELYLVALEALNNIAKHAQANRATVHLRLDEERCRLVVQDDGSGFDPEAAGRGGGQGLRSMQERVAQLGGRLDLETAPGQGTTVTIEVKA